MQDCVFKPDILFNEDELSLISDFFKTLFCKKKFSLIRKLLFLANSCTNTVLLGKRESRPAKSPAAVNKINKVKKYVEENYGNPITVRGVAGIVGLSEGAFSRFFKKSTGLGFIAYVNEVRIREAARLLCETKYTIVETAYSTGFNTPYYFNEVFKRCMGMTPGKFRVIRG